MFEQSVIPEGVSSAWDHPEGHFGHAGLIFMIRGSRFREVFRLCQVVILRAEAEAEGRLDSYFSSWFSVVRVRGRGVDVVFAKGRGNLRELRECQATVSLTFPDIPFCLL